MPSEYELKYNTYTSSRVRKAKVNKRFCLVFALLEVD